MAKFCFEMAKALLLLLRLYDFSLEGFGLAVKAWKRIDIALPEGAELGCDELNDIMLRPPRSSTTGLKLCR
ncbi:hypothetical protein, partial [Ochrobactrum sp. MC-1LL]|uniref:hypothetical protein n=1 Tax=Ochrobactrum sp. MC-1LL TaxID=2735351 RepID=UPI001AEDBC7A